MNLYIDYMESIDLERQDGRYIGGSVYVRDVIRLFLERRKPGINVKILVYRDHVPDKSDETEFLSDEGILIRTGSLEETDYSDCDVLLLPLTTSHQLLNTKRIRKKYRDLKIVTIFHDRQHGIDRFDPMDRLFYDDMRRFCPVSYALYLMKKAAFTALYPGFVRSVDKMITVSNYSLQALDHRDLKYITLLYEFTCIMDHGVPAAGKNEDDGEYILFLSGERPMKNLARALLAYSGFYDQTHTGCRLFVTGIERKKLYDLAGRLNLSHSFIDNCVKTFGYVDTEELAYLYEHCRYLLFVSKAEGFGLPVLEAMQFGKTTLCSRQSSIPEVAGSILYYVNAYDVDSIREGLLYLNDDENLRYRERLVEKKKKIIDAQMELDKDILVQEITGQTDD